MRVGLRLIPVAMLVLAFSASAAAAQSRAIRPYAHGGVGIGRFVFLCSDCGSPQTALVPSASIGLSFTRIGLDAGLDLLGWTHLGDRYTILTVGTTLRPRWTPLFIGGGVGIAVRQFPDVCSSCSGTPGVPVRLRSSATDPAVMLQFGGRIAVTDRVTLEPFAQYSRMSRSTFSERHADHLSIGVRVDGR